MQQPGLLEPVQQIYPDVWLLPGLTSFSAVCTDLQAVAAAAPFRHMMTRRGYPVAAAMTNCGALGWTSSARGYAYSTLDPDTGLPWPRIPPAWFALAQQAAQLAGYEQYQPDACLVNRYASGIGMGRHRDDSERDFRQPIVSVSLGLPTRFAWWGEQPAGRGRDLYLQDGDVLVWGKTARLGYHAVRPVPVGRHELAGPYRYNLTFRVAG